LTLGPGWLQGIARATPFRYIIDAMRQGYAGHYRVAGTVTLIVDGARVIVVDPGHGGRPRRAAQCARCCRARARRRDRSGVQPSPSRPTLAATAGGVFACTHAWWGPDGPAEDPLATDPAALHASRERILALATVIVPGHGPAFRPGAGTPR
jgi:glyoxylase-like metal-dependent hydrolase (beta-lactamase superfamily II)